MEELIKELDKRIAECKKEEQRLYNNKLLNASLSYYNKRIAYEEIKDFIKTLNKTI